MVENLFLGPFHDLGRFISSLVAKPPPTRITSEEALASARQALARDGCDLSRCTVQNLHSFPVNLEPDDLFDLLLTWRQWPLSSFFPCLLEREQGEIWLEYRWLKVIPVVVMKLRATQRPRAIIYDIVWGIGPGGYHSFLIGQANSPPTLKVEAAPTTLSIFTTFPKTRLFPEAVHDQFNYDVYRKLRPASRIWR